MGYHGNINALVRQQPEILKQNPKKIGLDLRAENSFLKELGVSQEFFEIAQASDKGSPDKKTYLFLIPSPETFQKYGMSNVSGSQDSEVIKLLASKGFLLYYR